LPFFLVQESRCSNLLSFFYVSWRSKSADKKLRAEQVEGTQSVVRQVERKEKSFQRRFPASLQIFCPGKEEAARSKKKHHCSSQHTAKRIERNYLLQRGIKEHDVFERRSF
jgi:hypothetical protein